MSCRALIGAALVFGGEALATGDARAQQAPVVEAALAPGPPHEFELAVGASRRHPLALEAGQLLHVELREKGPRVILALLDPSGTAIARREATMDTITSLRLFAIAGVSGTYALEVRASGEGRSGSYGLHLEEPRPANDDDRVRVVADDALADAVKLSNEGPAESRRNGLARLDVAEAGFREAGDRLGRALALLKRGRLQFDSGQTIASDSIEESLRLFREVGDREGQGAALIEQGGTIIRRGDNEGARAVFEAAAEHARAINNRPMLSASISMIGVTFDRGGQAERAVELFTEALSLATEAGLRRGQGRALINLGVANRHLGELDKALEFYGRALSLWRETGRRDGEPVILGNIGNVYSQLGDDARASGFLEEALSLARATGLTALEATNLSNLAMVLSRRGDHDRAIELGWRSVELRRRMRDQAGEAAALHALGVSFHRSGESQAGRQHLGEALRIEQAIRERYLEAETLAAIAAIERDRGNLREALAQAASAVALTEELRSEVTSPDLRATFTATGQDTYAIYIDILMCLHAQDPAAGHDAAALQVSERARARVLLEALIEARADIRQGVEPALLERERALQKELSEASARLSRALAGEGAEEEVLRAREQLEGESDEYRRIQSRIRHESPRYAALTQPTPATLEQVRREVLDDDTVCLEFYLGKERSFLWAVTRSALVSHTLPGQAPIEAAARKVHALMIERQRTRAPDAVREADRQLETESMALSRLLLGGVAARLATDWKGRRLLIVTSGALAYLPFGALPSPAAPTAGPVLADHEIVFAPSASLLVALRQEQAARATAGITVAVLADPVFDAADPRVRARTVPAKGTVQTAKVATPPPANPIGLTRAMESLGRERFSRLPFSRAEADAISAFVPHSSLLKATDFDASRTLVTEGALGDRRVIHFATHGLLNSEHPDLSGLVMSLVDKKGAPRDGFLRMHEIYNLRLPADLVVLSACQTALGREIRGEGLVGLTRGFMYAGARRVVASLWQVDDQSTAELMKRFYRAMLKDGRRPADALRAAQLEMSRDLRWSAPFYWAGFVLQGEWR